MSPSGDSFFNNFRISLVTGSWRFENFRQKKERGRQRNWENNEIVNALQKDYGQVDQVIERKDKKRFFSGMRTARMNKNGLKNKPIPSYIYLNGL